MRYKYLRGRLRAMGLTDADLAKEIGMTSNAMSRRMTGRVAWSMDEMYETLRVCDAPAEELHLYFPKNGVEQAGAQIRTAPQPKDAADEAAKYLSGFIRCVMEGARA